MSRTNNVLWVTGPSGAGKSTLISVLRERKLANTFDLDFIGYRRNITDWKEWTIPAKIFETLAIVVTATNRPYVAVGCDSHPDDLRSASLVAGFETVVLLPTLADLQKFRRMRGDKPEKVASAEHDIKSWKAHAARWGARTAESIDEIITGFGFA